MANHQVLAAKERVQRYLTNMLGSIGIDSDGDFNFRHGSAQVFVRVRALGDDSRYLVDENHFRFGHLVCSEKDGAATIALKHNTFHQT